MGWLGKLRKDVAACHARFHRIRSCAWSGTWLTGGERASSAGTPKDWPGPTKIGSGVARGVGGVETMEDEGNTEVRTCLRLFLTKLMASLISHHEPMPDPADLPSLISLVSFVSVVITDDRTMFSTRVTRN